ncbi:MAG: exosortase system-associated protein, TIGR04073 family [Candidatus Omnitrophica bacterium]|nr:exosortase system-associated protein, TIGR04073 family [Candidatus Omnitrophota bacterium]
MNRKLTLLFILIWFGTSAAVLAEEGTSGDYLKNIGTKLGRGLLNVVTSPAEIPCTIGDEMGNHPSTGFFSGLGKGTVFMLRRILVGVTEIGTFMIPMERTIPPVCHEPV